MIVCITNCLIESFVSLSRPTHFGVPFPHIEVNYLSKPAEFMFYLRYLFLCANNFKEVVVGVNGNDSIFFVSLHETDNFIQLCHQYFWLANSSLPEVPRRSMVWKLF